jgi:hypothetical protein
MASERENEEKKEQLAEIEKKQLADKGKKNPSPYDLNSNDKGEQGVRTGRRRGGIVRANAVQSGAVGNTSTSLPESDKIWLAGLSTQQWETLVEMLRAQKTNPSEKMTGKHCTIPWIIDTGASNHMTGSVMSMHDLHNIQSCPVGLPDGQHTTATKEGTVILDGV